MTPGLDEALRIAQEHGSDLALVVNHSGGKDSMRMLGFVRKKFRILLLTQSWQTRVSNTS